jgi:hypothetical protein
MNRFTHKWSNRSQRLIRSGAVMELLESRQLFSGYTLTDLGTNFDPVGINSSGEIVGENMNASGNFSEILLRDTNGNVRDLTSPGDYGSPGGINDSGVVVGTAYFASGGNGGDEAVIFDTNNSGVITPANAPNQTDDNNNFAAVDSTSFAVGSSTGAATNGDIATTAAFYNGSSYQTIGTLGGQTSMALGVSNFTFGGTYAVGYSETADGEYQHAFIDDVEPGTYGLNGGIMQDIHHLISNTSGDSQALGISPNGDFIVGSAVQSVAGGNAGDQYPFIYDLNTGFVSTTTSGLLPGQLDAVNDYGVAVGGFESSDGAFVETGTNVPTSLDSETINLGNWQLTEAVGINDSDQIIGYAYVPDGNTYLRHGFLLTPDTTGPTQLAKLPSSITSASTTPATTNVTYTDPAGINQSTISGSNLVVTGPSGQSLSVSVSAKAFSTDGTEASVSYQIAAPGGSWTSAEDGTYKVYISAANSVADKVGNTVVSNGQNLQIGTFTVNIPATVPIGTKLTGTAIGTSGSYSNDGNTIAKALDGNLATFFDGPTANGDTVGLDLGTPATIESIAYASRNGFASRMNGGTFQASNSATFASGDVTLYTIASNANPSSSVLTVQNLNISGTYRYVRYVAPAGSYGDVAEVQFYGKPGTVVTKLTGTTIGTAGSYGNSGNTIAKAVDGNLSTFFDGPVANGDWVGLDLGSSKTIGQISFAPRSGFASRMVGGEFQISTTANFTSGVTTIYTITTAPVTGSLTTITLSSPVTARYVRYLSPNGGYGDVAEISFYG